MDQLAEARETLIIRVFRSRTLCNSEIRARVKLYMAAIAEEIKRRLYYN